MIDSLLLRLNNLQKHRFIVDRLNLVHTGYALDLGVSNAPNEQIEAVSTNLEFVTGSTLPRVTPSVAPPKGEFSAAINIDTGELYTHKIDLPNVVYLTRYFDKGGVTNTRARFRAGSLNLTSGHYGVAFIINHEKDCIEFSFSVPKLLYGTNVFQFIEHYDSTFTIQGYRDGINKTWDYNKNLCFKMLANVVPAFFNLLFPALIVDYKCVEFRRIDLCYNQIFSSEQAARDYLATARTIRKKYARKGFMQNFQNDNILIYNSRYAVKIYHKGDEFAKNDYKQLAKFNKMRANKGLAQLDLKAIQKVADCTLRYEITFHSKYISYLYMQNLARSGCFVHNRRKELYKEFRTKENQYQKNVELARAADKEFELSPQDERERYRQLRFMTAFSNFTSKRLKFRFDCSLYEFWHRTPKIEPFSPQTLYYTQIDDLQADKLPPVYFNTDVLGLMIDKLRSFISEYELEKKPVYATIMERLLAYNANQDVILNNVRTQILTCTDPVQKKLLEKQLRTSKIQVGSLIHIIRRLDAGESVDEVLEDCPKRTKYDILAKLKKIGVDRKAALEDNHQLTPQIDFSAYHEFTKTLRYKPRFVRGF